MKKFMTSALSIFLCFAMLIAYVPEVLASDPATTAQYVHFDDAEVPDTVSGSDCFYIGSQNIQFSEKSQDHYLLKIGRGGSAESASDLTVKITDVTAKLDENYTVEVYSDGNQPVTPDGYQSIVEGMTEDPDNVTDQATGDTAELEQQLEDQDTMQQVKDSLAVDDGTATDGTAAGTEQTSIYANNPLAMAKSLYTGTETDRQPTVYDAAAAQMNNAMSDGLVVASYGYTIDMSFAAGETEKYLCFTPKYSDAADGDMTFMITLQNCTGSAVVSSLSTVNGTITDEDEKQPIQIGFAESELTADPDSGSVDVVLERKGSINDMASVTMTNEDGTAVGGKDYAPVNSELYFPLGIYKRTIPITIRHTNSEDTTFTLKLSDPSNCEVTSDTLTVTIPGNPDADEATAELQGTDTTPLADTTLNLANAQKFGGASWIDEGDGYLQCDTKPEYYGVLVGTQFHLDWSNMSYAYDGVRVNWELDKETNWWYSDGYTKLISQGSNGSQTSYSNDEPKISKGNQDIYFGQLKTDYFQLIEQNTGGVSRLLKIHSVTPIKRTFNVTLKDADPLEYKNVPAAEAAAYTSAMLENSASATLTKLTGDTVSVTATNPNNYARLVGLKVIDNNKDATTGKSKLADWQFITSSNNDSNTITFNLTPEMLEKLGPYMKATDTKDSNGKTVANSKTGNLTIQPVFDYRNADLTIKSSTYGGFADQKESVHGYTIGLSAGTLNGFHLGDRIVLQPSVNAAYNGKVTGTGFGYHTQLNANAEPNDGTVSYVGNPAQKIFTFNNKTNVLTPIFADVNVVVSVKKDLVSSFEPSQGIFAVTPTYDQATDSYLYTVVDRDAISPGSNVLLTAVPKSGGTPVWNEAGNDTNYGGTMFAFTETTDAKSNVITLSLSSDAAQSYTVKGSLYNADVNLFTGREGTSPSIPANGAVVFYGNGSGVASAAAGLTGAFSFSESAVPGMSIRTLVNYNGAEKLVEFSMPTTAGNVDTGVTSLASQAYTGAGVENVRIQQEGSTNSTGAVVGLTGTTTTFIATVRDNVAYKDQDGKEKTEKIQKVYFLFLDGTTKQVRSSSEATQDKTDSTKWTATEDMMGTKNADRYTYGDLIYVQIVTDKQMSDAAVAGTEYAPLATGYQIIAGTETNTLGVDFTIPVSAAYSATPTLQSTEEGYMDIPLIGYFNTIFQSENFSLTLEKLANNALRLRFGISFNLTNPTEKKDGEEKIDSDDDEYDDGTVEENYDVTYKPSSSTGSTHLTGFANANANNSAGIFGLYEQIRNTNYGGIKKAVDNIGKSGKYKLLLPGDKGTNVKKGSALGGNYGSTQFAVIVTVGGYLDFAKQKNTGLTSGYLCLGCGAHATLDFTLAKNFYTVIWVVPVFVGFSGDLSLTFSMRLIDYNPDEGFSKGALGDLVTFSFKKLFTQDLEFSSMLNIEGTVGAGIAKMAAVRGYAKFLIGFKWQPQLMRQYKDLTYSWGALATVDYGVAIDFMGASFPFSLKGQFGEDTSWADLMNAGFYKYFHEDHTYGNKSSTASLQDADLTAEPEAQLEERAANAQWVANDDTSLQSAYKQISSQTLMENGYKYPESQIISLGDGKMLMVFLADDATKADTEVTSLQYSVYDDSKWSSPVTVQDDKTGDYYPNVCDAGDSVMISWASTPAVTADLGDVGATKAEQAQNMEIYTVLFNKTSKTLGTIERLTTDKYFDAQPVGVYDAETGDRTVYYLKNSSTSTSLMNYANPDYNTDKGSYTTICYMLYNNQTTDTADNNVPKEEGWAKSIYFKNEGLDADAQKTLTDTWGGQRFLASPVDGMEDPLITDFTAAPGYNGIAVYAFTVDMDRNLATTADRELFTQVYDFSTHMTYKPIRITNDSVGQAQPQLVRQPASGTNSGNTYLFWLDNQKQVKYISVTDLVKYGINSDGTLKTDTRVTDNNTKIDKPTTVSDGGYYTLSPSVVEMNADDSETTNLSTYKAIVDNDGNLYVVWPQHVAKDGEKVILGNDYYEELYATGLISSGDKAAAAATTGKSVPGSNWSLPYQLTNDGKYFYDGVTGAVDSTGNLMLAYNRYTQTFNSDDTKKPITVSDMALEATKLRPSGSVTATNIEFTDGTPTGGKDISVRATFVNTGLTAATGYTAKFYECKAGQSDTLLNTDTSTDRMVAATASAYKFKWTVPKDPTGYYIKCVVTETGYDDVSTYTTDPFEMKAAYQLDVTKLEQQGDDFIAEYTVKNTGNATSTDSDVLRVCFDGPYGTAEQYGLETDLLAQESMAGIAPGQSKTFTSKLNLPIKAFDKAGFIACCLLLQRLGKDSDGNETRNTLCDSGDMNLTMTAPVNLTVNDGSSISTSVGSSVTLSGNSENSSTVALLAGAGNTTYAYAVADSSIAQLSGSTLIGKKAGTTTLTVYAEPYGISKQITVTVQSAGSGTGGGTEPATNPITVTQSDGGTITLKNGMTYTITPAEGYEIKDVLVNGKSVGAVTEYTFPNGTTAGTITATFQQSKDSWVNPYTDVKESDWFYDAVRNASMNKIMNGTGDDKFSPTDQLTRGMFVTMLARFDGADVSSTSTKFTDVDKNAYYAGAVAWASSKGVVKGVSDTEFAPDLIITREQLATMMYRYAVYKGYNVSVGLTTNLLGYTDAGSIHDYAIAAVQWAVGAGIIKGRSSGLLNPLDNVTRAEAAQVISNFMNYVATLKS